MLAHAAAAKAAENHSRYAVRAQFLLPLVHDPRHIDDARDALVSLWRQALLDYVREAHFDRTGVGKPLALQGEGVVIWVGVSAGSRTVIGVAYRLWS